MRVTKSSSIAPHQDCQQKQPGSAVLRTLQHVKNFVLTPFRVSQNPHQKLCNVGMGQSMTVYDNNTTLSTRHLSDSSALAVLSDWNGSTYGTRTLMNLIGSALDPEYDDKRLDELKNSLANGGKVIWVGGLDSQSDRSMKMSLRQEDGSGRQPLLDLLNTKRVFVTLAGASGIDIKPDGTFELAEGGQPKVFENDWIKHHLNIDK